MPIENPLKPCRACGTLLLLWEPPLPPRPPGLLIDGAVCICPHCANVQVQTWDMKLRDLTREERYALQPGTPAHERDFRWENVKMIHDQFARKAMERMSKNHSCG